MSQQQQQKQGAPHPLPPGGRGGGNGNSSNNGSSCQVRCAGCHWILAVEAGMTEFSCPKCRLPQMLPPQLLIPPPPPITTPPAQQHHPQPQQHPSPLPPPQQQQHTPPPPPPPQQQQHPPPPQPQQHPSPQPPPQQQQHPPPQPPSQQQRNPPPPLPPPQHPILPHPQAQGIDPTKLQLPCARCKAILNVPHGLTRFSCPQCGVDLAVDLSKLRHYLSQSQSHNLPPFPPPPPLPPSTTPTFPPPAFPPTMNINLPPEETNEVAVDVEREEDEGGLAGETFMDYHPSKLSIGSPHPDPVVETSSLSAVQPPEPTYELRIRDELEVSNALSCLQIETIIYACQRHLQHLPNGTRAGFFVGDGAGVGKGRTVAGLIWECWKQGKHKVLWVSVSSDLKFDARRDLDDVGATCIEVLPLNKLPYSKLDSKVVGIREGVIFLTYNSLIASSEKGRTRLQQLVQWCESEFDGLIILDECHKAKNLIPESGGQPTRTGEAVVEIQNRLPEARVVYCSATGASEPRNMGYMVRLGLWGEGTSFPKFTDLLGSLDKGGVGALELMAMDMKGRGMYVCRTLSYRGAEFDIVEAPLVERMLRMYTKAAELWADLRVELLAASSIISEEDKPNASLLWRLYWASHQRFFRHMCMSAKVPIVVKLAKKALQENKCVVIGLQSTGEARTEEAITKYGPELDDFVSGPRELLLKLVEENYPLPQCPEPMTGEEELQNKRQCPTPGVSMKGRTIKTTKHTTLSDDESDELLSDSDAISTESDEEFQVCDVCNSEEEKKRLLRCSCCDRQVHATCLVPPVIDPVPEDWSCDTCKDKTAEYLEAKRTYIAEMSKRYDAAKERKLKILELVRQLDLPTNPLDDIIDQLGGPDNVAEITGRRGMLVRATGGKGVIYQARSTKEVSTEMMNMHEKQLFMDGKKFIAIISEAGSAGVSLQADKRSLNRRRRVHLTLELPWSADRAIQQFGRTHRSNQASAPEYRLLFTNLGGERRFASIVAKRLESLGALTQGDRRAGPSLSAYNYDSSYGKKALVMTYKGIMEQVPLPVTPPGCSLENPNTVQEFLNKAKAALVSVGIVRDAFIGTGKDAGKIYGRITDSDMHDVGRFLNRLLGLAPDVQNRIFEFFCAILDTLLRDARKEGLFDTGIVDIKAGSIVLQGSPKVIYVDRLSGASTMLFTFTVDRGITWEDAKRLLEDSQHDGRDSANDGFYESQREWMGKRHFMLAFEGSEPGLFKIFRPAVGEALREMPFSELKNKYRKVVSIEKAYKGWQDEYEVSCKQCMHGPKCKLGSYCTVGRRLQEVNVIGGLILPVWGIIEMVLSEQARQSHRRIRVIRLETTTDKRRIVGLFVPNAAVESVLQGLVDRDKKLQG